MNILYLILQNDEFRSKIDMLLKDVNKRKTEAKRFLFLLDRLCDLRKSREKSAIGRGEAIKSSHQQLFYSSIGSNNFFYF